MLAVLLVFISPFGSGIPAGVLLAQAKGLAWPLRAGLYLGSDTLLALAFEPVLRPVVFLGRWVAFLVRFGTALKEAMARSTALFGGPGTGP